MSDSHHLLFSIVWNVVLLSTWIGLRWVFLFWMMQCRPELPIRSRRNLKCLTFIFTVTERCGFQMQKWKKTELLARKTCLWNGWEHQHERHRQCSVLCSAGSRAQHECKSSTDLFGQAPSPPPHNAGDNILNLTFIYLIVPICRPSHIPSILIAAELVAWIRPWFHHAFSIYFTKQKQKNPASEEQFDCIIAGLCTFKRKFD